MKTRHLIVLVALTLGAAAHAQMPDMAMPSAPKASGSASKKMIEAEALKVDSASGKVTLRHGPIENLGMPGMTMAFPVADNRMLTGIKDGDRVRFTAERVDGVVVVTRIEPAK